MKRLALLISALGFFLGALWLGWSFRAANALLVDLDLVWLRIPDLELWWLLLAASGFGSSLATGVVGFAWLRGRVLNRRYRKAIKRLESELHQMRSLPLASSESEAFEEEPNRVAFGRG
ncbi:MAG: DUF1049 domain-containing protein [bacterium]|nr:hypothetical protein [Deltaproteobacteria bacterium]MCP4908987.1 DUF1049 domain-containing protein [bacterium]